MIKNIFKSDSEYDKINYFKENGYVIFRNLIPLEVLKGEAFSKLLFKKL